MALLRCPGGRPAPCALTGATLALPPPHPAPIQEKRLEAPAKSAPRPAGRALRQAPRACAEQNPRTDRRQIFSVRSRNSASASSTAAAAPPFAPVPFSLAFFFFFKARHIIDDVGMMAGSCRRVACAAWRSIRPLLFDLAAAARAPSRQRARARARHIAAAGRCARPVSTAPRRGEGPGAMKGACFSNRAGPWRAARGKRRRARARRGAELGAARRSSARAPARVRMQRTRAHLLHAPTHTAARRPGAPTNASPACVPPQWSCHGIAARTLSRSTSMSRLRCSSRRCSR